MTDASTVTADQLRRDAYLYVRQSTLYQVVNNTESTLRQYDLKSRAVALGWPAERVVVIDVDQGQSGASAADREGFQRLVADVSLGKAGIVLGLECSRLARNNADWQRLLQLCALTNTLICDEDGLYDPCAINDRLLLGLKGTLSEAELHLIRSRLRGGILAKARRGELATSLPAGLVYDPAGRVALDPDAGVRQAIAHLFTTFEATGSARAVVKAFAAEGLSFPGRHCGGPHSGELYWAPLAHDRVLKALHNPRYAGAYVYGRERHYTGADGRHHTLVKPREEWLTCIQDAHPGYLSWEQFEANQATLAANAATHGEDRRAGPAREGPALLQGLVVCGRCGQRMTVRYHARAGGTVVPDYVCQAQGIATSAPICQHMQGAGVDDAVAALVLDTVTPLALEVALSVTDEVATRAAEADRIRASHVARAQHTADTVRRRYLAVDPANRLVADTLEADYNTALRELAAARDDYDRAARQAAAPLSDAQRAEITALAADFPALWRDPATPQRERKRLLRLVVDDVTLLRADRTITAGVRMRGGACHTLAFPLPRNAWEKRKTAEATIELIDSLLADHTYGEVAAALRARGVTTGGGLAFTASNIRGICERRGIPSLYQRLRDAGMLTLKETATTFGAHPFTIKRWHSLGLITGRRAEDRGTCLYHPGQTRPAPAAVTAAAKAAASTAAGHDRHGIPATGEPGTVGTTCHDADQTS